MWKGARKGKGEVFTVTGEADADEPINTEAAVEEPAPVEEEYWYDTEWNPTDSEEYWYNDAQWMSNFATHESIETTGNDWRCTHELPVGRGFGMIDSGASASVCGKQWLGKLVKGQGPITLLKSDKVFRFGDGVKITSIGYYDMQVALLSVSISERIAVKFRIDVIPGEIPMLIAYKALYDWRCSINFHTNVLSLQDQQLALQKTNTGHIFIKFERLAASLQAETMKKGVDSTAYCNKTVRRMGVVDVSEMNATRINKLHQQLGHASAEAMCRLFKQAGYTGLVTIIQQCVKDCGCEQERTTVQRPIINTHVPTRCGEVIGMDIMYPIDGSGHSRPYLIIADRLSRYTATCRMNSHKPDHAIDLFYKMWLQQLGRPGKYWLTEDQLL